MINEIIKFCYVYNIKFYKNIDKLKMIDDLLLIKNKNVF